MGGRHAGAWLRCRAALDLINAVMMILRSRGLLTDEIWLEALQVAQQEDSKKSKEAAKELTELQDFESYEDILKDFSGPIQ